MSGIVRIKDLDTAEELTSGDYLAVDSAGEGLRKVPLKPITDDISDLKSALVTEQAVQLTWESGTIDDECRTHTPRQETAEQYWK